MSDEDRATEVYRLVLRRTVRGFVVQFRTTGPQGREATLVRVAGRRADQIFRAIVETLKREGLADEEVETTKYSSYKLAQPIGAAVGGFLIIVRRSRDPMAWVAHFSDLIGDDKYPGSREALGSVLRLAIQMSSAYPPSGGSQLNPRVLDALSAGLKVISRKLWGLRLR